MIYLLLGGAAGILSGLFGVGGGVFLVPLLLVSGLAIHQAVATSLVFVFAVALFGVFQHRRHASLPTAPWSLLLSAMLGALSGASLAGWMPERALTLLFALLIGFSAWRLMIEPVEGERAPQSWAFALIGGVSGLLGGLMGVGGGFIMVPLLHTAGVKLVDAIKLSLMSVVVVGLSGALTHAVAGRVNWEVAPLLIAGGLPGIRLGSAALHRLPAARLKPVFVAFLCVTAVWVALR